MMSIASTPRQAKPKAYSIPNQVKRRARSLARWSRSRQEGESSTARHGGPSQPGSDTESSCLTGVARWEGSCVVDGVYPARTEAINGSRGATRHACRAPPPRVYADTLAKGRNPERLPARKSIRMRVTTVGIAQCCSALPRGDDGICPPWLPGVEFNPAQGRCQREPPVGAGGPGNP